MVEQSVSTLFSRIQYLSETEFERTITAGDKT